MKMKQKNQFFFLNSTGLPYTWIKNIEKKWKLTILHALEHETLIFLEKNGQFNFIQKQFNLHTRETSCLQNKPRWSLVGWLEFCLSSTQTLKTAKR